MHADEGRSVAATTSLEGGPRESIGESEGLDQGGSTRDARVAGFLAILYGGLGVFAGLSGAATFIPYRIANGHTLEIAEVLTVIAAIGAIISLAGVVSGWWLLRRKGWAWRANLSVAVGCVAAVAALAVVMPPSTPSPVPGGVSAFGFLAVVAAAYGLEVLLVLLSRRHRLSRTARGFRS